MQNKGTLVACDQDSARIRRLTENLQRLDVTIACPLQSDWTDAEAVASAMEFGPFDRILLDAPCSNTGVMRRRVDVRWRLTPRISFACQKSKSPSARGDHAMLKARRNLVYSTCSIEPEENEEVVARIRKNFPRPETTASRNPSSLFGITSTGRSPRNCSKPGARSAFASATGDGIINSYA